MGKLIIHNVWVGTEFLDDDVDNVSKGLLGSISLEDTHRARVLLREEVIEGREVLSELDKDTGVAAEEIEELSGCSQVNFLDLFFLLLWCQATQ